MKLLVVAHHFPPEKSVGADRPYSLFRYGRLHDCDVRVVTVSNHGALSEREDRVMRFDSIAGWIAGRRTSAQILYRIKTRILAPLTFRLDFFWIANALRHFALHPPTGFSAVYAVYPSASALTIGSELNRRFGIPLIVDFTDCLGYEPLEPPNILQRGYRLRFERDLVRRSRITLTIGRRMGDYLRSTYPGASTAVVYNGFDQEDFRLVSGRRTPDGKTRIAHFGGISSSRERDASPLFDAVRILKTEGLISPANFELSLIGAFTPQEHGAVERRSIHDVVRFRDRLPKPEGLKFLAENSDFLLLYGAKGERGTVTSKLLEYLNLGIPILGICKGNEAEEIIARCGAGEPCDFTAESVAGLFRKALRREVRFAPKADEIRTFDRAEQAREIFTLIRKAVS